MPHVGIQRFGTRHAQHNRAKDEKSGAGRVPHELQRVPGVERQQDLRMGGDLHGAQHANSRKPDQRDGPEKLAYAARAAFLHEK